MVLDKKRFLPTDVGPGGQQVPHRTLHHLRRLRLHRPAGGRAGRRLPRRGGVGAAAGAILAALQGAHRPHPGARQAQRRDPGGASTRSAPSAAARSPSGSGATAASSAAPTIRSATTPAISTPTRPRPRRRRSSRGAPARTAARRWRSSAARYGKFIGCSGYPKCKHIEPLETPEDTGVDLSPSATRAPCRRRNRAAARSSIPAPPIPSATTPCGTSPSPNPVPAAAGRS